mmetsp:Transcript_32515/g.71371  ORF Transcript_32515/g.71371 Transcript_32515/m.71371 type:complete len:442 (-) Transcript_32515:106-1431(-)
MKLVLSYISWAGLLARASSFQLHSPLPGYDCSGRSFSRSAPKLFGVISIDESTSRDIPTMEEWAAACGVQRSDGFQLSSEDEYGQNIGVVTTQDLPADSPVLYVPEQMILTSRKSLQEIGRIDAAEKRLVSGKAADHVPQFYLFLKILLEYEKGDASPWYPWLNSLPRYYSSGSSMTPFCFECLPPLASYLAMNERIKFIQFFQALQNVEYMNDGIKRNKELAKFAFAVVYTRGFPTPDGDFRIVPLADMFNHGTETEIVSTYDEEGNYCAYTSRDVPAGSPLRMSYGDSTNPSSLFAKYGFLDETAPGTFCKIMINRPSQELINMGYDHSRMLFYKDTGAVSEEVWDVLLFQLLENNPDQQVLYQAQMNGDANTKRSIHEKYYPQTYAALQNHVDSFLNDLDVLSGKAAGKDINEHPRLPLIMGHNEFVRNTFMAVKANL